MKRYYCNGKKGYCDRGNDNNINCQDCEFANGTGGKIVDVLNTNYDRIKNMSVMKMAEMFAPFVWKTVCECDKIQQIRCERYGMPDGGCVQCITNDVEEWLESEVTEK